MLDEGLAAGLAHLGVEHRTVCYVEREAAAGGQLACLMEAGLIDQAPVWSDVAAFDARAWRGRAHCLTAGFPCQPWSAAGKRLGARDPRWLWPSIADAIEASGVDLVYLENVRRLVSAGGLAPVLGDLAALGFDAEWEVLRASDVGAAHRRERVFVLAYRERARGWFDRRDDAQRAADVSSRERVHARREAGAADAEPHSGALAEMEDPAWHGRYRQEREARRRRRVCAARRALVHADRSQRVRRRRELGLSGSRKRGAIVADACSARREGRQRACALRSRRPTHRPAAELRRLFAPGPEDPRWAQIIDAAPWLSPATEPGVHGVVDGLALVVDESRRHQLRAIGNGVVALQAAAAFILLAERAFNLREKRGIA
jgi:DNA (cytosine-5)-methyltransferase 1